MQSSALYSLDGYAVIGHIKREKTMGSGKQYKCNKCGYEFTSCEGVGFMFPQVYEDTIKSAKQGTLGEEMQDFLTSIRMER